MLYHIWLYIYICIWFWDCCLRIAICLMILLRQKDQVGLNWILDFNSSNIFHGFEFGQTKVGSPRISPQRWLLDDEVNKSWKPVQFSDVLGEHGDCSTSSCNSYRILVAVALFFFPSRQCRVAPPGFLRRCKPPLPVMVPHSFPLFDRSKMVYFPIFIHFSWVLDSSTDIQTIWIYLAETSSVVQHVRRTFCRPWGHRVRSSPAVWSWRPSSSSVPASPWTRWAVAASAWRPKTRAMAGCFGAVVPQGGGSGGEVWDFYGFFTGCWANLRDFEVFDGFWEAY